jgi:hypothetical protein
VNAVAEFLKAILARQLVGWAALALASGAYLVVAQWGLLPSIISASSRDLLSIGAVAALFVSTALLSVRAVVWVGSAAGRWIRRESKRTGLLSRIRKLSPEAQAIVGRLVMRNESQIWLTNDCAGAHELRKAKIVRLAEIYGRACLYEVDLDIHFELQQNLGFLDSLRVPFDQIKKVDEFERRTTEILKNRWMGR